MQQLVPRACPPTSTNHSVTVPVAGPGRGKGRPRGEAKRRGLLALPLALGMPPAGTPQLCLESTVGGLCSPVSLHIAQYSESHRGGGGIAAPGPGALALALGSWRPLLPQCPHSLPVQVPAPLPRLGREGPLPPPDPSEPALHPRPPSQAQEGLKLAVEADGARGTHVILSPK